MNKLYCLIALFLSIMFFSSFVTDIRQTRSLQTNGNQPPVLVGSQYPDLQTSNNNKSADQTNGNPTPVLQMPSNNQTTNQTNGTQTTVSQTSNSASATSSPATIIVPEDYSTIQAAIDNASAGDTIFVRAGTYNCTIQINKPLTLKGESNQNTTLRLQYGGSLMALHVIASNVTISGFHLIGDNVMCIVVDGRPATADNCVIKDNVLEEYGTDALVLHSSHGDEVVGNVISSQDGSCMFVSGSSNCLLENNSLSGSSWTGIFLGSSFNNTVSNNFITNEIGSGDDPFGAITIGTNSGDNTVTGNTLVGNRYGVGCWQYTRNNVIYHNNFVNNIRQADDTYPSLSANFWDNGYPSGGNFWSDYNGTDGNGDGIGDTPYVIDANNKDRYPLMASYGTFNFTQPRNETIGPLILDVSLRFDSEDFVIATVENADTCILSYMSPSGSSEVGNWTGVDWTNVTMARNGNVYNGTIPTIPGEDPWTSTREVFWKIYANDVYGNSVETDTFESSYGNPLYDPFL